MNQNQYAMCLCHGAMMHALPRNKNTLKRMSNAQILSKIKPYIGKVPPKSEKSLDNWIASTVNPRANQANQLSDLGELAELDGIGKKLKKLAKKIVEPIKKITVDPLKKVFKKLEDSSTVKKIARPLAYAIGAATGTAELVATADQTRNAAIAAKTQEKINKELAAEAEYIAQAQAADRARTEEEYQAKKRAEARAKEQAQAQTQTKPQAAPSLHTNPTNYNALEPQQPQYGAVQRLSQDEQQVTPQVIGLNTRGIIDSIKNNPLPWGIGAAALLFLVMKPSQPQYVYREPR